jgi:hypothetical protein
MFNSHKYVACIVIQNRTSQDVALPTSNALMRVKGPMKHNSTHPPTTCNTAVNERHIYAYNESKNKIPLFNDHGP